jgi:hypothetical protein
VAHCDLLRRQIDMFLLALFVIIVFCKLVNHLSLLRGPLALAASTVNTPAQDKCVCLRPIYKQARER